jgi:hypothetical protein
MAVECSVSGSAVETAGLDAGAPCVFRQSLDVCDGVRPGLAAVASDLKIAIIGSRPNRFFIEGRLGYCDNGAVILRA